MSIYSGPKLSKRNTMQAHCIAWDFPVAPFFKSKKKHDKYMINPRHLKYDLTCNQHKNINEMLYILFSPSLQNPMSSLIAPLSVDQPCVTHSGTMSRHQVGQ